MAEPAAVSVAEPPVRTSLRLLWLAGLVYAVAAATHPGTTGRHLAAAVLTTTTAIGWAAWLTARHRRNVSLSVVGIVLLAASGGVLVVVHPIGVAVVGVAGMCAASLLDIVPAAALTAPGVAAAAIAVAVTGHDAGVIASAASGAAAGLVIGVGRRQGQERIRREAELAVARQRAVVAQERAEILAERNRLAREVHDVLAHTLGALAVQMEAAVAILDDEPASDDLRSAVARSRTLVTDGLDEARHAVRALRDEPIDVGRHIAALVDVGDASFDLVGAPCALAPATGLAFVRVAQEALTNARKHAPGAHVSAVLAFADSAVALTVTNGRSTATSPLATTGAGYGIQGMRERMEAVGGTLSAGAYDDGWRVRAEVGR